MKLGKKIDCKCRHESYINIVYVNNYKHVISVNLWGLTNLAFLEYVLKQ
jgi:hypothetical protein